MEALPIMSVGLKRGTVHLQPYDPKWSVEFEQEKQKLLEMLGNRIIAIEHIGSTAVSGLSAKPIIDMVAAVSSFNELEGFIDHFKNLAMNIYLKRMFADRKFFPKDSRSKRTHHLNLVFLYKS